MRIPAVSLSPVMMRSMPSIDQIARVEKRVTAQAVTGQRPLASTAKPGTSATSKNGKLRQKKRKSTWDELGQEVDVFA